MRGRHIGCENVKWKVVEIHVAIPGHVEMGGTCPLIAIKTQGNFPRLLSRDRQ